jgi:hypothetical protein
MWTSVCVVIAPAVADDAKARNGNPGGVATGPVNFANPDQLLERRRLGEQPCDWESYEDVQVMKCEDAVDGAIQLVVKATGRIYDSLKKSDPAARKVLDASAASWWKYFKQCDLFAPDREVIAKNGQLSHHGAAGRCRYGIAADRLRELLDFEELVRNHRQNGAAKR